MMSDKTRFCTLNLAVPVSQPAQVPESPTRERLKQAFARLKNIDLVRNHRQDPGFGKADENRIVWRELLELELQAVDDQLERISVAVRGDAA
jgi:hypothetical protein